MISRRNFISGTSCGQTIPTIVAPSQRLIDSGRGEQHSSLRAKNVVLTNSVTVMDAIENGPDQLRITFVEDVSLTSGFSEGPMLSMWPTLASKKEKKLTKIIVNMGHFNEQIICRIKIVDKRK